jgi:hypothetical protein
MKKQNKISKKMFTQVVQHNIHYILETFFKKLYTLYLGREGYLLAIFVSHIRGISSSTSDSQLRPLRGFEDKYF